jgi:Ca2+-binding EF-hand superfamily protein
LLSDTFLQTTFFWVLLVRQILRYYDLNPASRPATAAADNDSPEVCAIKLSQQQHEQIREIFELFDTDGGGSIAATEMDAAMLALGFKTSKHIQTNGKSQNAHGSDMDSDLKKIDKDGSKTITLDEFTAMMTGEALGLGPLEAIWSAFSAMSHSDNLCDGPAGSGSGGDDGWGVISIDGLRRACKMFDVKLSEDELQYMFSEIDTNGDGTVDRMEFMRVVKNAPWF